VKSSRFRIGFPPKLLLPLLTLSFWLLVLPTPVHAIGPGTIVALNEMIAAVDARMTELQDRLDEKQFQLLSELRLQLLSVRSMAEELIDRGFDKANDTGDKFIVSVTDLTKKALADIDKDVEKVTDSIDLLSQNISRTVLAEGHPLVKAVKPDLVRLNMPFDAIYLHVLGTNLDLGESLLSGKGLPIHTADSIPNGILFKLQKHSLERLFGLTSSTTIQTVNLDLRLVGRRNGFSCWLPWKDCDYEVQYKLPLTIYPDKNLGYIISWKDQLPTAKYMRKEGTARVDGHGGLSAGTRDVNPGFSTDDGWYLVEDSPQLVQSSTDSKSSVGSSPGNVNRVGFTWHLSADPKRLGSPEGHASLMVNYIQYQQEQEPILSTRYSGVVYWDDNLTIDLPEGADDIAVSLERYLGEPVNFSDLFQGTYFSAKVDQASNRVKIESTFSSKNSKYFQFSEPSSPDKVPVEVRYPTGDAFINGYVALLERTVATNNKTTIGSKVTLKKINLPDAMLSQANCAIELGYNPINAREAGKMQIVLETVRGEFCVDKFDKPWEQHRCKIQKFTCVEKHADADLSGTLQVLIKPFPYTNPQLDRERQAIVDRRQSIREAEVAAEAARREAIQEAQREIWRQERMERFRQY